MLPRRSLAPHNMPAVKGLFDNPCRLTILGDNPGHTLPKALLVCESETADGVLVVICRVIRIDLICNAVSSQSLSKADQLLLEAIAPCEHNMRIAFRVTGQQHLLAWQHSCGVDGG